MKVIVLTLNGKKLEYEINETETVLSLKEKIGKERALTPEKMRLFYRKKFNWIICLFPWG